MNDIKQFKLTSGEEIICEVIEWATEQYSDIVTRRCFMIKTAFDKDGIRFYSFRPYMALQEGPEMYITMNNNHIISEGNPDETLVKHYRDAVRASEMTESEVEEKLDELVNRMREMQDDSDGNVITFRKPVIH